MSAKSAIQASPVKEKCSGARHIQPKLLVNAVGDRFEQEADAMAEKVAGTMQAPHHNRISQSFGVLQRKCAKCEEEEKSRRNGKGMIRRSMAQKAGEDTIQRCAACEEEKKRKTSRVYRKADHGGAFEAPPDVTAALSGGSIGGSSLVSSTLSSMESAFDTDFSAVRVHTDARADDLNRQINAKAFTYGNDIYFSSGTYLPHTAEGKKLLAHELTHVVQQSSSGTGIQRMYDNWDYGDSYDEYVDEELESWKGMHQQQSKKALAKQKVRKIGEDIEITREVLDAQRLNLFNAAREVKTGGFKSKMRRDENLLNFLNAKTQPQAIIKPTNVVPEFLLENWGYSKSGVQIVLDVADIIQKEYGTDIVIGQGDVVFDDIPTTIRSAMQQSLIKYYGDYVKFAANVDQDRADFKEYADEQDSINRSFQPRSGCNVNHHSVRPYQPPLFNYKLPPPVVPVAQQYQERVYFIFGMEDVRKVDTEFGQATNLMDRMLISLLSKNSPAVQEREYIQSLLQRQEQLMKLQPESIRIPAVFYPQKEYTDVRKADGAPDKEAKEIPWTFYLYNTAFKGHDKTAMAEGEWVLADLTTPPPKGNEFVANRRPSQPLAGAMLQQGWIVDPPVQLFKDLNTKIRFPKGHLYWTAPRGGEGSIETTEPMTVSDWLTGIGMALIALGLILLTAGAATPFVMGTFALASAFSIAGTVAGWEEKKEHNMLTDEDINEGTFSIIMDAVSIISFGVGKFASVSAKAAQAASKVTELRMFVGRFVVPMVNKVDKTLEIANLLFITGSYIQQYNAIENSSMTDAQKAAAKKRLAISALKTGAMIIGPKVIGHYAAKRPSEYHLEVDAQNNVHLKTSAADPHQQMDPSMANDTVLAKKPAANGHHIEVTERGIELCSPPPCSLLKKRYKTELDADPELKQRLEDAEKRYLDNQNNPVEAEKAAAEAQQIEIELLKKKLANTPDELARSREKTLAYHAKRVAAGKSKKGGPFKGIFNIKEKQWILKRQLLYMNRTILEQASIVGVELPNGTIKPIRSISPTGKGRTLDFLEIADNKYTAGDLKSSTEFQHSVEGGLEPGDGKIFGKFDPSTKIGGQHGVEDAVLDYARKHNGKIVVKGKNVRTGLNETFKIEVDSYGRKVVVYEDIGSN